MFNFKVKGTVETQAEDLVKDIISKVINVDMFILPNQEALFISDSEYNDAWMEIRVDPTMNRNRIDATMYHDDKQLAENLVERGFTSKDINFVYDSQVTLTVDIDLDN